MRRSISGVKRIVLAAGLGVAGAVFAAPDLPADIQSFTDSRDGCEHFRAEPWDPGDEPEVSVRREFIFENLGKYCSGTDRRLAELREKYRENSDVIERLGQYEDEIELQ